MRAVILSAAPPDHASLSRLLATVERELPRAGYDDVTRFDLAGLKLASCQGEFDCWTKTPGECRTRDAEAALLRAVHDADAVVLLGPLTFGGHGHLLKTAVDRLIPLLSPFFTRRSSLTHHVPRYARIARLFAVGWTSAPSPALSATFSQVHDANAVNYLAPESGSVVLDDAHADDWARGIAEMLQSPRTPGTSITGRDALRATLLRACAADLSLQEPRTATRAALLVGSPKAKGTSASEAMARAIGARLERRSIPVELHFASEFVHDNERARTVASAIAANDLFLLVTPLYADALPALTTHALELICAARGTGAVAARFATLINCGFPEPEQVRSAMRIARHFADASKYTWGGGLPLGGGGIVDPSASLENASGRTRHVTLALDLSTDALSSGHGIPERAIETIARPSIPDALYRVVGDLGWRLAARKNGIRQRSLLAKPLGD